MNIYERPIRDQEGKVDRKFMMAVYEAFLDKKPILCCGDNFGGGAINISTPMWLWKSTDYWVDPACKLKIAVGHNPFNLLEEHVEVSKGYRLLTREEITSRGDAMIDCREIPDLQLWNGHLVSPSWSGMILAGNSTMFTYRTKLTPEQVAALIKPKEKKRVPLTLQDLPPLFLLRADDNKGRFYFPTSWGVDSFTVVLHLNIGQRINYVQLLWKSEETMNHWEYSTDAKNWKPLYKEVEE